MSAAADLLLLVLQVLPGEIREWLKAERDISGKRRDAGKEVRCLRSAEADSPGTQTDTY